MDSKSRNTTNEPAYRKRLTTERARLIYRQVLSKMKKDKTYRNPDYTVKMLAADLQTNTRYISAALAIAADTNYNQLVNELRLREVRKYFKSEVYSSWSVQNIGLLSGFSSRQAFYQAFHKVYHCTPKDYRESLNQK